MRLKRCYACIHYKSLIRVDAEICDAMQNQKSRTQIRRPLRSWGFDPPPGTTYPCSFLGLRAVRRNFSDSCVHNWVQCAVVPIFNSLPSKLFKLQQQGITLVGDGRPVQLDLCVRCDVHEEIFQTSNVCRMTVGISVVLNPKLSNP